ncbi:MAG TPA: hypothetical protein VFG14_16275 [Chthoniobacteraceae bacterium]|nr:hypothetical protein [Chthoniobacteraceae bacterium]
MGAEKSHTPSLPCRWLATTWFVCASAISPGAETAPSKPDPKKPKAKLRASAPKPRPGHGVEPNRFNDGGDLELQVSPPRAPKKSATDSGFNPDPGGTTPDPKWDWNAPGMPSALSPSTGAAFEGSLFPESSYPGNEAYPLLSDRLELPRRNVRSQSAIRRTWEYPEYYKHDSGYGRWENSEPMPNRWAITVPHWQRYMDPSTETPYMYDTPRLWHPYEQSLLKGDSPILGTQNLFLNITAKNFSLFEKRKLPVPSGVSAAQGNSSEFFGRSEQLFFSNDTSIAFDLFEGETAFKPVHWLVRVLGVYNNNWIRVKENGLVDPDPRGTTYNNRYGAADTSDIEAIPADGSNYNPADGIPFAFSKNIDPADVFNYIHDQLEATGDADDLIPVDDDNFPGDGEEPKNGKKGRKDFNGSRYTTRHRDFFALQEAFAEIHVSDITDNYDFISSRFGIQPFVSDFRGFIFADTNLGIRLFGNYDNNRINYNLAYFNMREKDTYSDLNTFDSRHQHVLIANVFKQDFIWKGYTAQVSFHMNLDEGGTHYDKNGFLTRPQILGTVPDLDTFNGFDGTLRDHDVKAYYLGWTGDGHIGRFNITHALYYVFGEDQLNGLAGRRVDISAGMAALELSYDRDWIRFKLSGFYSTGDSNPFDGKATGFDTILDHPFFVGGPFSWYVHQGFNLAGTGVNLKQRDSLIPNLRSSKTEGQSNFVNPGVTIVGFGTDFEVTPKLRAFFNANYIWLNETEAIRAALFTNKARTELGLDLSLGFKYRPLLTENIIFSAGIGVFFPGAGYRDIYRRNTEYVPGYGPQEEAAKVDRYLYNGFATLTLIY